MSDLKAEFEAAVAKVQSAPADGPFKPSNDMKLKMYGLFNQATKGDVSGKRPGMLDMVGRMKYDAWAKYKGTSAEDAMRQYVDEIQAVAAQFE